VRPSTLASHIAALALNKKASAVVAMDLRGISSVADYFVVCSGDSDIQVKAIADAVEEGMEKEGACPWHREAESPNWVVLDYVDVVVHIFHTTTRNFYNLEKLWGDAKITRVDDKPKARAPRSARSGKAGGRSRAKENSPVRPQSRVRAR
jgi:ribosome-associated protein